jgi:hypothetical protein
MPPRQGAEFVAIDANGTRIEIGDTVRALCCGGHQGKEYKVTNIRTDFTGYIVFAKAKGMEAPSTFKPENLEIIQMWEGTCGEFKTHKQPKEEVMNSMNKAVTDVYEKTADAILVNKYFGHSIPDSTWGKVLLQSNKEAVLKEAQAREEEEKKKGGA